MNEKAGGMVEIRRLFLAFMVILAIAAAYGCGGSTQRMTIAGESMTPTLVSGDKVTVDKKAYASAEPQRGDIIAFTDADGNTNIKRVVGLAGETVELMDKKIYVNGEELKEDYIKEPESTEAKSESKWTVPGKCVFVLGDNRTASRDSRDFGAVEYGKILGKVTK